MAHRPNPSPPATHGPALDDDDAAGRQRVVEAENGGAGLGAPMPIPRQKRQRSTFDRMGWWLAALFLVVAVVAAWPRMMSGPAAEPGTEPDATGAVQTDDAPSAADPAASDAREALLAEAGDTLQLPWTTTDDPAAGGASGDVAWSAGEQRGYLLIRGLQPNDPAEARYQLWIFDRQRDDRYPVNGGVFDVAGDEVVIPIDAELPVTEAYLFAVTVEPPAGVVVSDRGRVALLAQAEAEP